LCRCDVQRRYACGKQSGDRESHSGVGRKPFAFPPESLFTFRPESRSPSPRNRFHVDPRIAFTLPRNPHPGLGPFTRRLLSLPWDRFWPVCGVCGVRSGLYRQVWMPTMEELNALARSLPETPQTPPASLTCQNIAGGDHRGDADYATPHPRPVIGLFRSSDDSRRL
jgi:hypothetical protein